MKCNTPIDPETKIALSGAALEAALKDPNSPCCGYELSADDIYCPSCGIRFNAHNDISADKNTPARNKSRWSFHTCVVGMLVGIILAVVVFYSGWLYNMSYGGRWLPVIYFIPLPLLFFPLLPAFAAAMTYWQFDVKESRFLLAIGAVFGCVAVYGVWYCLVCSYGDGITGRNPLLMLCYVYDVALKRTVTVNSIEFTGVVLAVIYYIEALVIFLFTVALSFMFVSFRTYCDSCSCWFRGVKSWKVKLTHDEFETVVGRIMCNKNDVPVMDSHQEDDCRYYRFRIKYCKECLKGSLTVVEIGKNNCEVAVSGYENVCLTKQQMQFAIAESKAVEKRKNVLMRSFNFCDILQSF